MKFLIFEPNKGCRKIPLETTSKQINMGKSVKQGYGNILLKSDFLPKDVGIINYYKDKFYFRSYGQINITVDNVALTDLSKGVKLENGSFIKIGNKSHKQVSIIYIDEDVENKWTIFNETQHSNILKSKRKRNDILIYTEDNLIFNSKKIEANLFIPKDGDLFCNDKYVFYCMDNNIYFTKYKKDSTKINKQLQQNQINKKLNQKKNLSDNVSILMKNVCRYDKKKKWYRLKNVNLKIKEGRLVAVMGISGAGKSTLFDALLGELKLDSGVIKIAGNTYGHVPQFSVLRKGNTVEDTMEFYAMKKLKGKTKEERQIKIDELLGKLNLSLFKKSLVGKLSGGQSRRLDIAVQLLDEPSVILMDEPDSGLDIKSCRELYEILYEITRDKNSTILVITHNTHMACKYPYIDNLLFMASQGRICFYGEKDEALNYFNINDLDDIYNVVENNQDFYVEKYNKTIGGRV